MSDYIPISGTLDRRGDAARYFFDATTDARYTVAVYPAPGSPLIPRFELYNPDGEWILLATVEYTGAILNGVRGVILANIALPLDGSYALYISGDAGSTGAFVVGIGQTMVGGGIAFQTFVRGELPPDARAALESIGTRDAWTVTLDAGDSYDIRASADANSAILPALTVLAPDGTVIGAAAGIPDAPIAQVTGIAPLAGVYTVYVADARGLTAGAYRIVWGRS